MLGPLWLQLRAARTISLNFITRNFRHPVVLVMPPLGTDEMGSFHITHIMYPSLPYPAIRAGAQAGHHHYVAKNCDIMLYLCSTSYVVVTCTVGD
ncbi:hypothetical protein KPH14_011709 [Odynerus spinipes]|uniref:Uncharacterized protein n=1 Tax=Odynerus spinipes TaxID=1348599 RepID=A0AAD9VTR0_9HYME|nr:hypothetical protein KPH14_011709 [Odynerus spinipes]